MIARFLAAALALAALVAGCAGDGGGPASPGATPAPSPPPSANPTSPASTPGPPPSTATPAPRVLTPAHSGGAFSLRVGQTASWILTDRSSPEPVLTGTSVLLIPVANVTDSGRREWELRAVASGVSTVDASGTPAYRVTLVVEP